MANQQGNGRNVAIPDENRQSWRPQDENGVRGRRGMSDDDDRAMSRERDDDRYMQDRGSRWERDEGYRSTERYGQGQSGYGSGRYEEDRSFSSRNQGYPGGMDERARERGLDERFSQGRGGGSWADRSERSSSGVGYGHGDYRGYPSQPDHRYSAQQFGDEQWGNEGYASGTNYGNQGGHGAQGHWRDREEWRGGNQRDVGGRDWRGGPRDQGWQGGRDWQGGQGEGREGGGRDWQGGHTWQGSWGSSSGGMQGGYGGGMQGGYGGSGMQGGYGGSGMQGRGMQYGGEQPSQHGGRGAQGQGGVYGQGGYNEGMYGQGGVQNRYGSEGYQGWGQQGGQQGGFAPSHRGKGPSGYTRSDERVRELVCEALSDDHHVDATNIDITVKNGEVVLSGTVQDRHQKRLAEDIAEQVSGVKDVQNQIRVASDRRGDRAASSQTSKDASATSTSSTEKSEKSDASPSADKRHRA